MQTLNIIKAVTGCEVKINDEEIEGIENDSIIFIPKNSKLSIKNNTRYKSAIVKIQLTVYNDSQFIFYLFNDEFDSSKI